MKTKRLLIIIYLLCLFPFPATAFDKAYPDGYPVIPPVLVRLAKTSLQFDDAGSRLLYEKIPITADVSAWMMGWFWDNYKIVVGITDQLDIIYYSEASLGNAAAPAAGDNQITAEKGFLAASEFIGRIKPDQTLQLVGSKAFTYQFAEYYQGIRVAGHDATVVVDKFSGKVYYYKGFGKDKCEYELMEKLISKDYAYQLFFENIGLELVYYTKYDERTGTKTAKPMYIINGREKKAVDAQTGEIISYTMYDYNYYYNDRYYDKKYTYDNNIKTDEAVFSHEERTGFGQDTVERLKNLFYCLRNGYEFSAVGGVLAFDSEKDGKDIVFPVWQVNIVPRMYAKDVYRIASLYDKNDMEELYKYNTQIEYVFARAYINAQTGELLQFDSVANPEYTPAKPWGQKETPELPKRVAEFAQRATDKYGELQFFGQKMVDEYTQSYCYARYVNGARVIGEGMLLSYNKYANDITKYRLNMNLQRFVPLDGVKTVAQMAQLVQGELSLEVFYVDKDEYTKIPVYDVSVRNATFDPVTGNRNDRLGSTEITRIFICQTSSKKYTVNGTETEFAAPVVRDGKIYVPLRLFAGELGYQVSRTEDEITLVSDTDTVTLKLGSGTCEINGQPVTLDEAPVIEKDLTYLSVLSICNIFGMHSWWDGESNQIYFVN